jgi:adenylosuccinate synthase
VSFIEREIDCPLFLVSVGYRRDETIVLRDAFG